MEIQLQALEQSSFTKYVYKRISIENVNNTELEARQTLVRLVNRLLVRQLINMFPLVSRALYVQRTQNIIKRKLLILVTSYI